MEHKRNGRGTARSTSWATPSAYDKQNDGEHGQTAGWSSRHYEGHRPDALHGSRWGRKNTSNVPDCTRFATWNIGTMSGKSAEVLETLHRIKLLEHAMKVTEGVFERRIRAQVKIDTMQFGFMPGKGATDAIFTI